MPRMTIRKNYPTGLKRWNGKFSMMLECISGKKILNHHCLPPHDQFGEFLMGFVHSTKSCIF